MSQSKTPRTDSHIFQAGQAAPKSPVVDASFARELESEVIELKKKLEWNELPIVDMIEEVKTYNFPLGLIKQMEELGRAVDKLNKQLDNN